MSNRKRHEPGPSGPGATDPFLMPTARQIGRREFVRTSSGLLVAATMFGCSDPSAPDAGVVRVVINGLGAGITTAGSATITGEGITPINLVLPPIAEGSASVKAGNYHVVYAPPAGYTMAPGELNEIDVIVEAGATTNVEFDVVPATGTLRVTVTGLAGGAASGGGAQALRTDIGGQTPLAIVIPGTGTVDSSVAPGTYSVTFSAPAGYQLTAGATNPVVVVVASSATATANFAVEEVGEPPAVIFHSDWSTALGTTSAALGDNGKALPWNVVGGQGLEVIQSTGLDFPTTNVLRVTSLEAVGGFAFLRRTGMPIPAVGESRWYRWYIRVTTPNGLEDPESHPFQDGNAQSQANWLFHVYHDGATPGTWRPQFRPAPTVNAFPNDRWNGPDLPKNATFRFELQIHRTATNSFQMHVRVYDAAGTQIHTDASYSNQQSSATLATNPTFTFLTLANLDGLNAGCNGIFGTAPFPFVYGYQGAVAVSGADWLGPYSNGI
jgi:hypothetical protein